MAASARIEQARSTEERIAYARRLVPDEHAASVEPDALAGIVAAALGAYERLRTRDDIVALLRDAHCAYEVPFSMQVGDAIVRGSIDCLIRRRAGGVVVLEFKTGSPRESHRIQLDQYLRAARSMYPDQPVEGQLIYL
jgi:hypothetical protein